MFGKINKALQKIRAAGDLPEEQKSVLDEIQRVDNYRWTIVNKRHTYTDGVQPCVSTEGMIIVVKKPILRIAQELFSIVSVQEPYCLGEE